MNASCRSVADVDCFTSTVDSTTIVNDEPYKGNPDANDKRTCGDHWQNELLQACQLLNGDDFRPQIGGLIAARFHADWVAVYRPPTQDPVSISCWQTLHPSPTLNSPFLSECEPFVASVAESGQVAHTCLTTAPTQRKQTIIAVPLPQSCPECLVVAITTNPVTLAHVEMDLRSAALHMANWNLRSLCQQRTEELEQLAALTDLISQLEASESREQACQTLVQQLCQHFGSDEVIAALCSPGKVACHVVATSSHATIDPQSEHLRLAQAALQESIARADVTAWPSLGTAPRHALRAHQQFAQYVQATQLISAVLRDDVGNVQGAWLLLNRSNSVDPATIVAVARASQLPLANALNRIARAEQNHLARVLNNVANCWQNHRGRTALTLASAVMLALLIPVRYRVRCDLELQPIARRFVAAPFDGTLLKSYVEPGDLVTADTLLAQMDEREVRWESAGTEAELHRAAKEHAGYIASHETGKANLAEHEVARLRMRNELLLNRVKHLEIRSPVHGIVVAGDLRKSEGMPLAVGQTLFEVAPLDEMTVEVAIPEDDARLVQQASPIHIWLDAFPGRRWDGKVERIHPRAELKDRENVFVAELTLVNAEAKLRPGMRGQARIETVLRPWGWNLFHKAGASVLRWLGW